MSPRNRSRIAILAAALSLPFLMTSAMLADNESSDGSNNKTNTALLDTVYLQNGGTLRGTVEEYEEDRMRYIVVTTPEGAIVRLTNRQVKRIHRPTDIERQYHELLAQMEDTLEGHEAMQEWCVQNNLSREREFHLKRQIEIDPDYVDARLKLGYESRNGRWVHREQFLQSNGYVKDGRGIWRLPDVIERQAEYEAQQQRANDWKQELKRWRRLWERNKDRQQALEKIRSAVDPLAIEGLVSLLEDETIPKMKLEYVEVIGKIRSYDAQNVLTQLALQSPDRNVRDRCLTLLKQPHYDQSAIVTAVRPFLVPKQDPKTNAVLNAAAYFLGEIGHPSAIPSLFPVLITTHKLPPAGGNMRLSTDIDGNLNSFGSGQQPPIMVEVQNQGVLDALRRLTGGADQGFNEDRWLQWYIEKNQLSTTDLRRDD